VDGTITSSSSSSVINPRTPSRLENNIFNELMKNDNKYRIQIEEKFERLRIGTTVIEICRKDMSPDTIHHIYESIKHCKTSIEEYQILNGIVPDVIARITKQVEHRILAKIAGQDQVLLRTALNSMRELSSDHWRLVN
jgi:hypothetical protein